MNQRLYNNKQLKALRQRLRKAATPAERKIWSIIKNRQIRGLRFFRQFSVGDYILDFYCPAIRLCIETDGGQHFGKKHKEHDTKRTEFLKTLNIRVLRFQNNDVMQNIEGVYNKIIEVADIITPPNLPLS